MNTHLSSRRERGAVLIVALVFLVILTLLAVTAMTGTTMELRMSGNIRDLTIAANAAEAAMRDAEYDINGQYYPGKAASLRNPLMAPSAFGTASGAGTCNTSASGKGLCRARGEPYGDGTQTTAMLPVDLVSSPAIVVFNGAGDPSVTYGQFTGAETIKGVALQPRYVIESLCQLTKPGGSIGTPGSPCKYYRVTAQGYGGNPNSKITLTEVYTVY